VKTDTLFYELFEFDPQSFFQLVQLDIDDEYVFESITIKTTEKRLDGFFKGKKGKGPHVFLEVQGYDDPKIYWRLFRKIFTYYELKDDNTEFIAFVLFLDEKYDPGNFPLLCSPPNHLIRVFLKELLKLSSNQPGPMTVLKPLMFKDKEKLGEAAQQWKSEITELHLTKYRENKLLELLEYAVMQRFPDLTLKEVQAMLKLTPLDQTAAGQELLDRGREEGRKKGILIGSIRTAQHLLKHPVSSQQELDAKAIEELQDMLGQLGITLQ
jgi:predicted transposase YdaD